MRAVFDSNVWISAFRFKGRPLDLVLKAAEGEFELYTSQSIMDETTRVLREKFNAQQLEIDEALKIMSAAARKVEPTITLDVVKDDPKDNHIIECAVAAGAHVIVTGDKKHLLKMGEYQGIKMALVQIAFLLLLALVHKSRHGQTGGLRGCSTGPAVRSACRVASSG